MKKRLITLLQNIFSIDNPLLFVGLLCLIVFNRFIITFFNAEHHAATPDNYYYAGVAVGGDWIAGTVTQAYRLMHGLPMALSTGYGYSFTILTAWVLSLFNAVGICSSKHETFCTFLTFNGIVAMTIVGLLILSFLLIKKKERRSGAIIFLIAFLLGVPGGRGIETANLDIVLSVLYGLMLYMQRQSLDIKEKYIHPVLLGCIAAIMLQTKIFTLPIILIFLLSSTQPFVYILSFLITSGVIVFIPTFYGIAANPFQIVQAAFIQVAPFTKELYSRYTYGNNNARAMIGSIIFSFSSLSANVFLRNIFITVGGGLLFILIIGLPFLSLVKDLYKKTSFNFIQDRLSYPLFIVANCYIVVAIILLADTSYDYRFFYLIPLIYILLDTVRISRQKWFLGVALSSLIIRSLFILHTKVWNIFFLVFIYFFLLTCITLWIQDKRTRGNS